MDLPVDRFGIVRRSLVLRHGHSDDLLKSRTRSGELIHLGHGAYAPAVSVSDGPGYDDAVYRLRCLAFATAGRGAPPVLSHQSAAALHRLPLLKPDLTRVHLLSGQSGRGYQRHQRHLHPGHALDPTVIDAVRVTSLERTAIDVACIGDFAQALTALDGALRLGATLDGLRTELATRRRRGAAMAQRALEFADAGAESVGESWSRAQFILAGLPPAQLQVRYRCRTRSPRVDFSWGDRLVGEFDGMVKYGRTYARPGQTPASIVAEEKRREDELRALGVMVVRWLWVDLEQGRVVPEVLRWLRYFDLVG
ncbi:hypothetical protein MUG78_06430 [Gordonia alkaliphila]|uniref:hypothetical protein n=1 Tax=Gordonia alkaliphila TaxID=1053547 RepID=UPI001FF1A554|nr:hypothetical protein [Gordonia alkaliphila]MCK0439111.1 hypothetical protein [Gordonia alkaliphila]